MRLRVVCSSSSLAGVRSFAWSVSPVLAGAFAAPSLTALTLRTDLLSPGVTYTFRLTAVDVLGVPGFGEVSVAVNSPPFAGYVSCAPLLGVALSTSFYITTQNWADAEGDLPLI